jgi:hypothetical protein
VKRFGLQRLVIRLVPESRYQAVRGLQNFKCKSDNRQQQAIAGARRLGVEITEGTEEFGKILPIGHIVERMP